MFNLFKKYFYLEYGVLQTQFKGSFRYDPVGETRRISFPIFLIITCLLISHPASSHEPIPVELQDVGIEEHLGKSISLDLEFTDESGKALPLQTFFRQGKPVILMMVYYTCPNICHYLLDGFSQTLENVSSSYPGKFEIISVSINPRETSKDASQKKIKFETFKGWHFLTGSEPEIKKLADQLGFKYRYDVSQKQYAHSAAIMILTPTGDISRYLYGIQFKPLDLKLSLLEATDGKIGNIVDRVLLFCYHYDPKGKKYALIAKRVMAGAGVITILMIISLLFFLSRKSFEGRFASR